MFNPQSEIDVVSLWKMLGTVYKFMDDESKSTLEIYWGNLFNGLEGLYYNLAQAALSNNLWYSPGFIEHRCQEIEINFDSLEIERLLTPSGLTCSPTIEESQTTLYTYYISAVDGFGNETLPSDSAVTISGTALVEELADNPNLLSWKAVPAATEYNVYGRFSQSLGLLATVSGNSYSDVGNDISEALLPTSNNTIRYYIYKFADRPIYLSVPTLSGYFNKQVLYEDVDYDLYNLHSIRFLNPSALSFPETSVVKYEKYFIDKALTLIEIIPNLYLPAFGQTENPETIFLNEYYPPYISGWENLDKFERKANYSAHFTKWINALLTRLIKGPTLGNLQESLSLFYNSPFAYESGIVSAIVNQNSYNYFTIGRVDYKLPDNLDLVYDENEEVAKFALLCSGVLVNDYVSNAAIVSGLIDWATEAEKYYYTLAIHVPEEISNLNYYQNFIDYFNEAIIPPNIISNYY